MFVDIIKLLFIL